MVSPEPADGRARYAGGPGTGQSGAGVVAAGPEPWGLVVRGGSGGLAVGLDSLEDAALALADVAQDAALVAARTAAGAVDADVLAGALLSPATGVMASEALLEVAGPLGLGGEVAALLALAATVRSAAATYRAGEAAATAAVERVQDAVLLAAGALAPQLLVGFLALDALGVDVVGALDRTAFRHPGVVDLAGGAEGLLVGLRVNPLTAPFVPAPSGRGERPDPADGEAVHLDYERAVSALADAAAVWGLLDDAGRARVTEEPAPRPGARAPRDLADLAADQGNVGDGEGYAGHVRVVEVPQQHGSVWLVEISGTQAWDPRAGESPFDLTTDVRSMAQEATVLAEGVRQALDQAQSAATAGSSTGPDPSRTAGSEPVLLVGHSLGGITAAGLASSTAFTEAHRVTHVVTMGAPVARMPVPPTTEVLSLEHRRDPVPRLDGQPNPDRATWVTATSDSPRAGVDTAGATHDLRGYVETAARVDGADDPSLVTWRATSAAFFAGDSHGPPVIRDYAISRVRP